MVSTKPLLAVLIESNEAGFGNRCRQRVEAIEGADIWHQAGAFLLEHLPSCPIPELGGAGWTWPRRYTGLQARRSVRHSFQTSVAARRTAAGRRRPGSRPVPSSSPRRGCRRRDRPGNVRTSAGTGDCRRGRDRQRSYLPPSSCCRKSPERRLRQRRQRPCRGRRKPSPFAIVTRTNGVPTAHLARVGSHEQHSAMAKADVRHLHCCRRAIDHNDLMAPVKLIGLTWIEGQRHIGSGRCLLCLLFLLGP